MADKIVEFVADLMSRGNPKIKITNSKPDIVDTSIKTIELVSDGIAYSAPFIVGGALIASCGVWGGILGYQFARDFLKKDVTKILPEAKEIATKQKSVNSVNSTNEILKIAKSLKEEKTK